MLAGELALHHGDHETTLAAGDAVYFDAATPHSYRSAANKPAESIIVTMQQAPAGQPLPQRPQATAASRPASAIAVARTVMADGGQGGTN